MAKGHSFLWRKPGRRDAERKKFARQMARVEATRLRCSLSKTELASELSTTTDALRAWMTGRTVGRKETVTKIKGFLKTKETDQQGRRKNEPFPIHRRELE